MHAYLPIDVVFAVRLSTWHALFAARGYPPGLSPSADSHDTVAAALASAELPVPLARALFVIAAFATEAGRIDIYNAADALHYPTRWPDAESPADLVAALLAAGATDEAAGELLEAAQSLRDRSFRPWSTFVYSGARRAELTPGGAVAHARALKGEVARWAEARDFGRVFPLQIVPEGDDTHFGVVHEDRPTVTASAAGGAAPVPFQRALCRALRSHLLTLERGGRRLWITTDCLEAVTPLARIAGEVFFGDARHFLDASAVDPWRLQEHGAAALEVPALAGEVVAHAVGGTWHSGKKHALTPRGRDLFEALARYKIRIEGGRLDLVTLRALLRAIGAPPRCDIALRPPHLVTFSEPEHAPLLRKYLDGAKITSPDPRPIDFYSLQPWIDTGFTWIAEEGEAGFAWLLENGVLRPDTTNRALAHPAHPHAGRTMTAHPLRGNRFIAWSPDATVAPFVVEEKELVVYALSFGDLARVIAGALGLEGAASALDEDGVLYCGRRALASTHALVFLPTRPIRPVTVARLREAAGHGHAVLITPPGRMREQGLRELPMPKLAGPWQPLLGGLVRALHLEAYVETTLYAPAGARLVLHRATQRVWLDGVACARVTEMQFRLLEILTVHAGQPVHTKEIAVHVTGGNYHEDTTRRVIEGVNGAIQKSFKERKK
ncbi:MAG TPA: hypothetical protein VGI39_36875, partial [Polyangiaceae bacterium]